MRSAFSLPVVGEIRDDERRLDDPGTGGIAKKRKVPAYPQIAGKDEDENDSREQLKEAEIGSNGQQTIFTSNFRLARSKAAKACSFRKALFLRRKAALVTLYLDAQSALIAGTAHLGTKQPPLPDVPTFEKLIPSIEDIGVANWAPDEPGWRNDWKTEKTIQPKMLEEWRSAFSAKRRVRASRQPINRGGWAPEGSFEFDSLCKASVAARGRARDQAVLRRLVVELRSIVLSSPRPPLLPSTSRTNQSDETRPSKTTRRVEVKAGQGINAWAVTSQDSAKQPVPVDSMSLKEISEVASGKKQPKKKKRSDLANLSNPHHMTNYRPSRSVSPHDDLYEPYPLQSSLLLPPPMRLLSARPQRKTAPLPGAAPVAQQVRPAEDDYICCFCEMALFFGSEKLRKRAIRSRRAELKRKEAIKTKAENVAKGKGMFRDDDDDDDYDDDYEDDCQDGAGCGRCACGRALGAAHERSKGRLKPPETDPPDGTLE